MQGSAVILLVENSQTERGGEKKKKKRLTCFVNKLVTANLASKDTQSCARCFTSGHFPHRTLSRSLPDLGYFSSRSYTRDMIYTLIQTRLTRKLP